LANIRDVAKKAGVSIASVSRILSGDKTFSVSQETRRAVFEAIEELKYVYVPILRERRRTVNMEGKQVGCIITSAFGDHCVSLNYNHNLIELKRSLSEKGFNICLTISESELQDEGIFRKMLQNPLDALVYMANIPKELFERLHSKINYGIGFNSSFPEIDNVTFDKEAAIENAVSYLVGKGHKNIAYIGGPGKLKAALSTSRRYRGYLTGMEKNNLPVRPELVKNCLWLVDTCYTQTREILNNPKIPDAIICGTDNIVFSVYRAVYEKRLRIPQDIAVFGCEMFPASSYITPAVTSVEVPVESMADTAADLLFKRINGLCVPTMEIVFRSRMVIQAST
jgi:DNA-binding LacI/PurR family transcriptional regulator